MMACRPINRQLAACVWLIQSKAEMNLGAGLGVAMREFQTVSGPVDYGLFVGRIVCGVIEAKPQGKPTKPPAPGPCS